MHPTDITFEKAVALAHRFILLDGHIDLPWRLGDKTLRKEGKHLDLIVSSSEGDFDYVRAKQGGLSAAFMAIYIAASFQEDLSEAKREADSLIDLIDEIIKAHPDKFGKGDNPGTIEANFQKGLISLPMGLENGAPLATLDDVKYFFDRGIRYVTLTHAKDNHICDSSYDTAQTWNGLSPYGKEIIREMNATGMIIDISHVSDKAFYQAIERSSAPVIASHSSCRKFTPGWERNMDDDMIGMLAKHDGIIQINFGSDFLDEKIAKNRVAYKEELDRTLSESKIDPGDPEALVIAGTLKKNYTHLYSDVEKVADHIDHVRKLAGIEFVGIGSDFDGVGDSLPTGLKDVSDYPNLIHELLKRGYSEKDIELICYKNFWRVWYKVLETAKGK